MKTAVEQRLPPGGASRVCSAYESGTLSRVNDERKAEKLPRTWVLLLVLVCAAVAPQAVATTGGWIFDDTRLIATNPYVHGFEHWQHWFTSEFWDVSPEEQLPSHAAFWRPLVTASYALDWALGSGSPVAFHVTNLLLHGLATALTFVVLRRWLKTTTAALLATLLFSVHPFRTESVAWISGRPDPMVTVAVLLALQGIALRLRGRKWGIALEVVGTVAAYLSKEHAIVLPFFATMEAYVAVGSIHWPRLREALLKTALPQVLAALAFVAFRVFIVPLSPGATPDWPPDIHAGLIVESVGRYVAMLAWPHDLTFGASLIRLDAGQPRLNASYVVLGAAAALSFMVLGLWSIRRKREVFGGLLLTIVAFAPVSNLVPTGYSVLVSQRFLYLPALPLAFLTGLVVRRLIGARPAFRWATFTAAAATSTVLFVLNVSRSTVYRSEESFWHAEAQSTPDYYPALVFYTDEALARNRPRLALRLAHVAFESVQGTAASGSGPRMIPRALEAVLRLTPDLDRRQLDEVYRFLADARSRRDASLSLPAFGLQLRLPSGSSAAAAFLEEPVVDQLLIECAMRTGRWAQHRALAREIAEQRPSRAYEIAMQAAASHDFELARWAVQQYETHLTGRAASSSETLMQAITVLEAFDERPERVPPPVVASAYVRIRAWGQAYQVVRPFLQRADSLDADAAEAVAEVAYGAGDEKNARRVLAGRLPADRIEQLIAVWRLKMQWADAPRQPGERPLADALARRVLAHQAPPAGPNKPTRGNPEAGYGGLDEDTRAR